MATASASPGLSYLIQKIGDDNDTNLTWLFGELNSEVQDRKVLSMYILVILFPFYF